jgi:hypothetical protein
MDVSDLIAFCAMRWPSARTVELLVWNIIGYVLYAGLPPVAMYEVKFSSLFGMATDACSDRACDASHHLWPAMLTVWIGVPIVLLATLVVMIVQSFRGKVVVGWPLAGLLAFGIVFLVAKDVVLH